jgi:hypothetical protein
MDIKFTKLIALVDQEFTVEKAGGYQYKKWDAQSSKMLVSDQWQEGYRKVYTIDTDKGRLDLGSGQLSSLLEAVYSNGAANITNRTFHVKSNGKSGMDIRYYFNAVKETEGGRNSDAWKAVEDKFKKPQLSEVTELTEDISDELINLDDIPFKEI